MFFQSFFCCMKCSSYTVRIDATAPIAAQNDIERHLFKVHGITQDRAGIYYTRTRKAS